MEQVDSNELNYHKSKLLHPQYQLSVITQQSGGNSVNLLNTGGNQSIFELPSTNAFNLAKSCFSFTMQANTTAAYSNTFSGTISPIQQLTLYTRSGVLLCDIPDFQYFTNVTFPTDTPIETFATQDPSNLFHRNNLSEPRFSYNFGTSAGTVATAATTQVSSCLTNQRPGGGYVFTAATTGSTSTVATFSNLYDTEPAYVTYPIAPVTTPTAAATQATTVSTFAAATNSVPIDVKI